MMRCKVFIYLFMLAFALHAYAQTDSDSTTSPVGNVDAIEEMVVFFNRVIPDISLPQDELTINDPYAYAKNRIDVLDRLEEKGKEIREGCPKVIERLDVWNVSIPKSERSNYQKDHHFYFTGIKEVCGEPKKEKEGKFYKDIEDKIATIQKLLEAKLPEIIRAVKEKITSYFPSEPPPPYNIDPERLTSLAALKAWVQPESVAAASPTPAEESSTVAFADAEEDTNGEESGFLDEAAAAVAAGAALVVDAADSERTQRDPTQAGGGSGRSEEASKRTDDYDVLVQAQVDVYAQSFQPRDVLGTNFETFVQKYFPRNADSVDQNDVLVFSTYTADNPSEGQRTIRSTRFFTREPPSESQVPGLLLVPGILSLEPDIYAEYQEALFLLNLYFATFVIAEQCKSGQLNNKLNRLSDHVSDVSEELRREHLDILIANRELFSGYEAGRESLHVCDFLPAGVAFGALANKEIREAEKLIFQPDNGALIDAVDASKVDEAFNQIRKLILFPKSGQDAEKSDPFVHGIAITDACRLVADESVDQEACELSVAFGLELDPELSTQDYRNMVLGAQLYYHWASYLAKSPTQAPAPESEPPSSPTSEESRSVTFE